MDRVGRQAVMFDGFRIFLVRGVGITKTLFCMPEGSRDHRWTAWTPSRSKEASLKTLAKGDSKGDPLKCSASELRSSACQTPVVNDLYGSSFQPCACALKLCACSDDLLMTNMTSGVVRGVGTATQCQCRKT